MNVNKTLTALLIAGMAAPTLASTLITSFEDNETHGYEYGHFGSSTHAITADVQTDGDKSMQANMGASYEGGVKIYAPNSWNWSDQKELVFDVVNNTNEDINYGVKILTNYVWDDANALSEYFNVPANTTLKDVVLSLDTTEYGSIGASYNKAMAMEINFFAAESPNTTVYIDNIRVSDGTTEPTPPPTDPEDASDRISSAPVKTLKQIEAFNEIPDDLEIGDGLQIELTDSKVSVGDSALKVAFSASAAQLKILREIDFSGYENAALAIDVSNLGESGVWLLTHLENSNEGAFARRTGLVEAGKSKTLYLSLNDLDALDPVNKLGIRELPASEMKANLDWDWENWGDLGGLDSFLTDMRFFTYVDANLVLDNIRVIKDFNHLSAYEELVDSLGQNNQHDFYAKLENSEALDGLGDRETQLLGKLLNRSQYGGAPTGSSIVADQECKLATPASFNACKTADGKWYLVDPDGNAFISTGLANIRMTDTYTFTGESSTTPSDVRKSMFTEIPTNHRKEMGPVHSGPVEQGEGVSFYANNIDARHGGEEAWQDITIKRMQDWGFTSLGNWTDSAFYAKVADANMPYVANGWVLHHETSEYPINRIGSGYWGPIADPFDDNFALAAEKMAARIKEEVEGHEATLMGIFVDNEISWGNCLSDNDAACYEQTLAAMNTDASTSPAKAAFIWFLENGYGYSKTLEAFNTSWGTSFTSWSELAGAQSFEYSPGMLGDLKSLNWQFANKYFEVVNKAVKVEFPNNLYLGARFADWGRTPETIDAAKGHADVVSFNIYKDSITSEDWQSDVLEQIESLDFPAIIGEFHFGALDSGNFATGIVSANSQKERGDKYITYMESVLANDNFVGAHWFQYLDSPVTGRAWDGENYNVGFVNVTDTPYNHLTDAARIINCELYGDDCSALESDSETRSSRDAGSLYDGKNIGITSGQLNGLETIEGIDPEEPVDPPTDPEEPQLRTGGSLGAFFVSIIAVLGWVRRKYVS
ncbi:beta-agarase [Vibrio agarivorans]|uniref:beta-agarase n=1 Tax=Vibrio agarivorans TaxID=153622 RepID=UPI00222E8662|nr:beta-agarase [Vibrio agarivorans]